MTYKCLLYEVKDGIATLTLNRPDRLNALGDTLREDLFAAVTRASADPEVRVMVVTGAGKGFCAGGDVKAMNERKESGGERPLAEKVAPLRDQVLFAMRDAPQPIIAAVNGAAAGAGMNLALACDIRLASDDAQLGLTEVNLAIIPGGGGTQRLPRLVGRGKALEMILTGARISASEALAIRLVERVVPAAEVLAHAQALARTLADKAPVALRYAKEAVVKGLELPLADGLRLENDLATLLRTTDDRVEGARAFLEKRKPRFTGR